MLKLWCATGLMVLLISQSVGQTLSEDENDEEVDEPVHTIVKRGARPARPAHRGDAVFPSSAVHPNGGDHKSGSVHPAGVGESRDHGYSRHITQPHCFAFPTRFKGYISKYYYPEFEYAYVPSGYATNYYEVPVSGTIGGNTGVGAFGNNFGFGGLRALEGQGLNFAFSRGQGQGRNFAMGRGRSFGGSNFAFGGGRAIGGQGPNFAFGGARGFGGSHGNSAFPGKW